MGLHNQEIKFQSTLKWPQQKQETEESLHCFALLHHMVSGIQEQFKIKIKWKLVNAVNQVFCFRQSLVTEELRHAYVSWICLCFNRLPFYPSFEGDDVSVFLIVHWPIKCLENVCKVVTFTHTILKIIILKIKNTTSANSFDEV